MSEILHNTINQIIDGKKLDGLVMRAAFNEIMEGRATPIQITSFLISLNMRGETPADIAAGASILREKALILPAPEGAIDIVGTGGDNVATFNISTTSAMIVAGAGVPVAKHGNKAVSSKSGAADVLTALGLDMNCPFEALEQALSEAGIVFLMAPRHHAAMRHVGPVRNELGIRTIFNLLGPLANPALVDRILVGTYDAHWLMPFAEALKELGTKYAWIVHGADGLDELSTTGNNQVVSLINGQIKTFNLHPSELGLASTSLDHLKGGDADENAKAMRDVLGGKKGPYLDIALFNAAGALVASGHETDLNISLERARHSVNNGAALGALDKLITITNNYKK